LRDRLVVAVVGAPSGTGLAEPEQLQKLAGHPGIADVTRFDRPVPHADLADYYRAASVTVVPSYTESFGLVAVESQACGTPVVAARVGGLQTAVADGSSGILVDGHDPVDYANAVRRIIAEPGLHAALSRGSVEHAGNFGWSVTAARVLDVYADALAEASVDDRIASGQ
jgi:glycosyltransferase involved in cell wall biosynthesis